MSPSAYTAEDKTELALRRLQSTSHQEQRAAADELIRMRESAIRGYIAFLRGESQPPREPEKTLQAIARLGQLRALEGIPELVRWIRWQRPQPSVQTKGTDMLGEMPRRKSFEESMTPAALALVRVGAASVPHLLRRAGSLDASKPDDLSELQDMVTIMVLVYLDKELIGRRIRQALGATASPQFRRSLQAMLDHLAR